MIWLVDLGAGTWKMDPKGLQEEIYLWDNLVLSCWCPLSRQMWISLSPLFLSSHYIRC